MSEGLTGARQEPRGSILARTARGAGWVIAWRALSRGLGFLCTLVLVRLLSPADFGLVALATAFAAALEVCTDLGVEDQIIRTPHPTRALYDTAFTLNLARALLIGAMVIAAAGPAASFYEDPRLEAVLVALGALTAASGLASIGVVDFRRELDFEKEFRLQIRPRVASIIVAIALAFLIPGHWALVAGIAVSRLGRVVLSYTMHPYRPRLSLAAWRELAGVSFWAWAIGVVAVVRDRCDSMVIGRMLGPAKVGIFAAGVEVATLPATELVDPVCRACMPGFAATAREGVNLAETYRRIVGLTALLAVPAAVGISLVAADLIFIAYGPTWMAAVPVVMIIGLASALTPLGNISQALMGAQTMLRSIFMVVFITMVVRIGLLLALTERFGVTGAATAAALSSVLDQALLVGLTLRRLGLGARSLLPDVWRPLVGATVMAGLLWGLDLGWAAPPTEVWGAARDLMVAVSLGAGCYVATVGLLWTLCGRPAASAEQDALALVQRLLAGLFARLRPAPAGKLEPGQG